MQAGSSFSSHRNQREQILHLLSKESRQHQGLVNPWHDKHRHVGWVLMGKSPFRIPSLDVQSVPQNLTCACFLFKSYNQKKQKPNKNQTKKPKQKPKTTQKSYDQDELLAASYSFMRTDFIFKLDCKELKENGLLFL